MTTDNWMKMSYDNLKDAANNITNYNELSDELLHYSLDVLLQKKNLEEIIDSGGASFYVIKIMVNSWKSTSSPFYKTYRQDSKDICLVDEELCQNHTELYLCIDTLSSLIKKEIENLHWYDRELFKIFLEGDHTISSLSRETGIPRTSISLSIKRIRKHIIKKVRNS